MLRLIQMLNKDTSSKDLSTKLGQSVFAEKLRQALKEAELEQRQAKEQILLEREQERQAKEQAILEKEQAILEKEKLAQKLRELGIDPETI